MLLATMELISAVPLTILMRQFPAGQATDGAHEASGPRQYWTVLGNVSGAEFPVFTTRKPRLNSTAPAFAEGVTVTVGPAGFTELTVKTVAAGWLLSPVCIILMASPAVKRLTSPASTVKVKAVPAVTVALRSASSREATPIAPAALIVIVSEPP